MIVFTLMNKNKKILDFEYDNDNHLITNFNLTYKENKKYAPFRINKRRHNK